MRIGLSPMLCELAQSAIAQMLKASVIFSPSVLILILTLQCLDNERRDPLIARVWPLAALAAPPSFRIRGKPVNLIFMES
jgi:hypothetical protein